MGNRRCGVTVSWHHVSLHCPGDHTYSHTQQFTKIICVIATLTSQREQSRVAGLDPNLRVARVRYRVAWAAIMYLPIGPKAASNHLQAPCPQ